MLITHKKSDVSGAVPSTSDLTEGEIAVNTADGRLYVKKIVQQSSNIVAFANEDDVVMMTLLYGR